MNYKRLLFWGVFLTFSAWWFSQALPKSDRRNQRVDLNSFRATELVPADAAGLETATLGGGCFWCVEAVLERIRGVASVESGYAGGDVADPSYGQITTGRTGHAECVQVRFDPEVLSYEELLTVFWELHDPTTLNRQGADRGTHYRSVSFYQDEEQKAIAEKSLAAKEASRDLRREIVTEIAPLARFYPAESYHQDYFVTNPNAGYCRQVISPKLKKLGLLD